MEVKKIWNKTIDTVTVGWGEALDVTGAKKIVDDPEYSVRVGRLDFIESHYKSLIETMGKHGESMGNIAINQVNIGNSFVNNYQNEDGPYKEMGTKYQQMALEEKCDIDEINKTIPKRSFPPYADILKEIQRLRMIQNKTRKNLILYDKAQSQLVKQSKKGNIDPEVQATAYKRQNKYNSYLKDFISGVDILDSRKTEIFSVLMETHNRAMKAHICSLKSKIDYNFMSFAQQSGFNFPPIA